MMDEATWGKSSSKEEKFNQLWQGIKELKEKMLIQNEKLDKLTNITQNLEHKRNGIQQKMVEYENKLNQLEEEKEQLRDEMVQKTILLVFQLDRQEQYIRRENILIYGVEENKEDNDDGEKVLFKITEKQNILHQYVCFCSPTMLTSKIMTESVENRSECHRCVNSCNKFVLTRSC